MKQFKFTSINTQWTTASLLASYTVTCSSCQSIFLRHSCKSDINIVQMTSSLCCLCRTKTFVKFVHSTRPQKSIYFMSTIEMKQPSNFYSFANLRLQWCCQKQAMFLDRLVSYSGFLVGWHPSAVSLPPVGVLFAQLACPLNDIIILFIPGIVTYLSTDIGQRITFSKAKNAS